MKLAAWSWMLLLVLCAWGCSWSVSPLEAPPAPSADVEVPESGAWFEVVGGPGGGPAEEDSSRAAFPLDGADAVEGLSVAEVGRRAAESAADRHQTVTYRMAGSDQWIEANPQSYDTGGARVSVRRWNGSDLVSEHVETIRRY